MTNITKQIENFLDKQDDLALLDRKTDTRNYNNNNKDNKVNKILINYKETGKRLSLNEVAPLSVGTDSSAKEEQGRDLSKKWRTIKLDLFNNTRNPNKPYDYTLKVAIYLYQQCKENNWDTKNPINLSAKFNDTSLDSFNIGIIKTAPHYKQAREYRDQIYVDANQLGIEHISLNKFYIPSKNKKIKNKSIKNFSGLLIRDSNTHQVVIFKGQEVYHYVLSNHNLTPKQRKVGMIGSCVVRAEDSLKTQQQDANDFL